MQEMKEEKSMEQKKLKGVSDFLKLIRLVIVSRDAYLEIKLLLK
jgi:hypothetical protein